MDFGVALFWQCDETPKQHKKRNGNHGKRGRALLAGDDGARSARGRNIRAGSADDQYLLPAIVPGAAAAAAERDFLQNEGRSEAARLPAVFALQAGRSGRIDRARRESDAVAGVGFGRRRREIWRRSRNRWAPRLATLRRAFMQVTGLRPRELAETLRLAKFKKLLRGGSKITDALYETGYGSSSRVYERSNAQLGMTPATYRKGGKDMKIGYSIAKSKLGEVLVAATERGVSAVYLGDSEPKLVQELRDEYPRAEISAADHSFEKMGERDRAARGREAAARGAAARCSGDGVSAARLAGVAAHSFGHDEDVLAGCAGGREIRRRCELWRGLALRIRCRSSCRAIAWCGRTGISRDIAGESRAKSGCWSRSGGRRAELYWFKRVAIEATRVVRQEDTPNLLPGGANLFADVMRSMRSKCLAGADVVYVFRPILLEP